LGYEVALTISESIISKFPTFLLKLIYPKSRLKEEIKISPRTVNPIIFNLGSYVPRVDACFTISNFTNLTMKLLDLSADIWISQPLATVVCFDKPDILRKKENQIYTTSFLNEIQVSRIKEMQQTGELRATMYLKAYFESRVGLLELTPTIENCQVIIQ